MVKQLDDTVARGARGPKVLKELGLEGMDKSGRLLTVDDLRFDPIWEECGEAGIPVSIHCSDMEALFQPINETHAQYEELVGNPTWHFSDTKSFPRQTDILQAQQRVFARHPTRPLLQPTWLLGGKPGLRCRCVQSLS
jgi:hypothetical protein